MNLKLSHSNSLFYFKLLLLVYVLSQQAFAMGMTASQKQIAGRDALLIAIVAGGVLLLSGSYVAILVEQNRFGKTKVAVDLDYQVYKEKKLLEDEEKSMEEEKSRKKLVS